MGLKLLLAPHNDDEALYCAFTIMREKPIVLIVTDSVKHLHRYGITAEERKQETLAAMKVLGDPQVEFLGIPDDGLTEEELKARLALFLAGAVPDVVYAPAIQGGNPDHDLVGRIAKELFNGHTKLYATYTKADPTPRGDRIVIPTEGELIKKNEALDKYTSQLKVNPIYFASVRGRGEYFVD